MKAFYRLLAYARPHRSRLASAFIAMVVYGAASAGLAALIQPIFDEVLPNRSNVAAIAFVIIAVYVVKGVGAYLSSYLMADVGQRVVRGPPLLLRLRILFRHAQTAVQAVSLWNQSKFPANQGHPKVS